MDNYYLLHSKLTSKTLQVHAINLNKNIAQDGIYDEHKLILGEYDAITFPVIFKYAAGNRLADILDTGWSSLYLISDYLKSYFIKNKLIGWNCFKVLIYDKNGEEIKGYSGLSITGRSGGLNNTKSTIIEKRLVPNGPLKRYFQGLYFGMEKWDGSDFFLPENYFGVIVTERTRQILIQSKATNIAFQDLNKIERSENEIKI
jgi:hypothetical protein